MEHGGLAKGIGVGDANVKRTLGLSLGLILSIISMNCDIDSSPPTMEIAGGWTCESIVLCSEDCEHWNAHGVEVGARAVDLWYPADADAVVDQQIETGNEEDPFWCYLWPTARALAQQVFRASCSPHSRGPESLQVLETGCGIGLVGLAALAAGATTVTFQDLRSRSVELALHNACVNEFGDRARGDTFDWRSPPNQTFDWIIASDVLYHVPAHEALLNFLEGAIAKPRSSSSTRLSDKHPPLTLAELDMAGSIWIGDPGRQEAGAFIELAQSRFQIQLFDAEGHPLASPNRGDYQLIIMYPPAYPEYH